VARTQSEHNASESGFVMALIVVILTAFPLGYLVRDRLTAYVAFIAVHAFVFPFQSMELTRQWVGGDNSAYPKNPHTVAWSYGAVNLVIYAAGFGLLMFGRWLADRRRSPVRDGVDLAV
jgi:hypothetical protein